jgi:hypothetical protein
MMHVCPECTYAARGEACGNPACPANPQVPEAQRQQWRQQAARRAAEQAERARLNALRDKSFGKGLARP